MDSSVRELIEGRHITDSRKYEICNYVKTIRLIKESGKKNVLCELSDIAYEILKLLDEEEEILYNVEYKKYEDEENVWIYGISVLYHFIIEPDTDKCEKLRFHVFPLI